MAIRTAGGCLLALSIVGLLLTAGCTLLPPSGDEQAYAVSYPCSPLGIVSPIHYRGTAANGSGIAVTMLILNLTVASEAIEPSISEQNRGVDVTQMYITYTDGRDLYILEPGDYSISRRENGDDDNILEVNGVRELILPFQQPISANTNVYAEFWVPYHGTLTLSFRTPEVIELSGQVTEFTAASFVPH